MSALWSVRRVGGRGGRPAWAVIVSGERVGWEHDRESAERAAQLIASAPACLRCGAPVETGAETHPGCIYDARPATAEERERIARVRGGL